MEPEHLLEIAEKKKKKKETVFLKMFYRFTIFVFFL